MALIVEDGTGVLLADSYASVVEADAYLASYGNETWTGLSTEEKEIALRKASRDLDLMYGSLWQWYPLTSGQGLIYPKYADQGVPTNLKRAAIELAAMIADGYVPFTHDESSDIAEKSVKVDVIETRIKYVTNRRSAPELERIRLILGSLIPASISAGYARVVRG